MTNEYKQTEKSGTDIFIMSVFRVLCSVFPKKKLNYQKRAKL